MLAGNESENVLEGEALALVGLVLFGRQPERDLFGLLEDRPARPSSSRKTISKLA